MSAISEQAIRPLPQFNTQNLSNTAWAFAPLGVRDEPLLDAIAASSISNISALGERDLAALAWSVANLPLPNSPLLDAISSEVLRTMNEFAPRSLANISWAFANLGLGNEPLLTAIAAAAIAKISREAQEMPALPASLNPEALAKLEDLITNLNATVWALNHADQLAEDVDSAVHRLVVMLARRRDHELRERIRGSPPPAPPPLPPREVFLDQGADPEAPASIVLDLPDLCVVHKPPGWEVDCADVGTGILLSTYLQQRYSPQEAPLVHYEEHQFGMVHRLDRVSSGLLLVGKTFLGFHSLGWQLNTGRLEREYMVVAHGHFPPSLRLIDAKVFHLHAEGGRESQVLEQGKPSQTRVTTLGHYALRDHPDETFSIVVIQIITGRRHQIRTHLAHVGHPTVADGKYMSRERFVRDRQWCSRNFLHRYRLGFQDVDGTLLEAAALLPEDLRAALAHLVPCGPLSAVALTAWAGAGPPRPWSAYEGLPDSGEGGAEV
uniref:Pseudouridine synthase RsuA/RluA-like domain-containing protein n=1 Tax=Alexandrium monilatum TaxID=311494 RepID=A0A7S4RUQ2_9DINO